MTEQKFCKNCTHYLPPYGPFRAYCRHPDTKGAPDPVSGNSSLTPCEVLRKNGYAACGPDAKLFQPKETKTFWLTGLFKLGV
jgi:hypothetical protein